MTRAAWIARPAHTMTRTEALIVHHHRLSSAWQPAQIGKMGPKGAGGGRTSVTPITSINPRGPRVARKHHAHSWRKSTFWAVCLTCFLPWGSLDLRHACGRENASYTLQQNVGTLIPESCSRHLAHTHGASMGCTHPWVPNPRAMLAGRFRGLGIPLQNFRGCHSPCQAPGSHGSGLLPPEGSPGMGLDLVPWASPATPKPLKLGARPKNGRLPPCRHKAETPTKPGMGTGMEGNAMSGHTWLSKGHTEWGEMSKLRRNRPQWRQSLAGILWLARPA